MRTLSDANEKRMSVPATTFFNVERLRRYDGPEFFLGVGFVAGLLIFLAWVSTLPDDDRQRLRARGNGVVGTEAMAEPGRSVLGEITGDAGASAPPAARAREDAFAFGEGGAESEADAEGEGTLAPDPAFDRDYAQESDAMAVAEDIGAYPQPEPGALTDTLLDEPPPYAEAAPPATADTGAALRPWFVEIEVAPGQVQMLQLNAESPEHALAILRDFRGDPHVLRGPSAEPLP